MTDESINNNLNTSNKDTFLDKKEKMDNLRKTTDLKNINIRQTTMVERKIEKKTLDDLGKIEEAKKHRKANRPLYKIKEFNSNVNFCQCCNLPCEEKGIIEPFHFCDDIDKFAKCGLGVSLYFYFFRLAVIVLLIGIFVMAISMMVFNHHYTKGINRVCNNNYEKRGENISYCNGFITVANESLNVYTRFNDWILRFTSDNIKVYQELHNYITNKTENTKDVIINYSILNFFFLLTIFILNIFYIIFIAAQSKKAKILNFSIRDYTVLISNAKHILIEYLNLRQKDNPIYLKQSQQLVENNDDFINYVNEYIRSDKDLIDLKINSINMCYNLGNYMELRDEYQKCIKKIFKIKNDPTIIKINLKEGNIFDERYYYNIPLRLFGINCIKIKEKPLITLNKQKIDLEKQMEFEVQNLQLINESNFTGYMFVSFNKIKDKEIILKKYPNNFFDMLIYFFKNIKYYLCCCCMKKGEEIKYSKIKGIDVEDPPEPEDIYWENFKYNSRQRMVRIILVFILSLVIIGLSFLLVLFFTYLQNKVLEDDKKFNLFVKYLLSLLITIVISVINEILEKLLTTFTLKEKHLSRTSFHLSLSIKIVILTFFNSAIIPLISKELLVKKRVNYDYNIDRNNLLVNDMLVLFLVNALVTPILWTFSIPYLIKKLRIYLIERKKEPDKCHYMTQRELNQLYELPDMKIAYKYSYIAKTMAMTLFYLPIFPAGFIISCFGFILGYFLELYNFTHIYKRPEMLDEIITKIYADYFIIILFIGGIGDYFFFNDIFPNNKMSLANIIIFGILIIIPYTKFITCNFVGIDKSDFHNYDISDVYFTFYSDYQRQNPFTKRTGLLNYLTQLKKNGYLSDNAFKIGEENIENLNLMEIYYGISRGTIPIIHQSIMANTNNNKSISGFNIRNSIVAPNIKDNNREKIKKQKYFDSQILNQFGSKISKKIEYPIDFPMDTIIEEDEDKIDFKEKLINAYNNPLAINMGIPIAMDDNIYSSISLTKSFNKKYNKDTNLFKNNLTNSNYLENDKKLTKIVNIPNKEESKKINFNSRNKKKLNSSKNTNNEEIKYSLPFNSEDNSSSHSINNNELFRRNSNNIDNKLFDKNENKKYYKEEEEKNNEIQYNDHIDKNLYQNNIHKEESQNENGYKISLNSNINNNEIKNENIDNNKVNGENISIKESFNENKNNSQSINDENLNSIFNNSSNMEKVNKNLAFDSNIQKYSSSFQEDSNKNIDNDIKSSQKDKKNYNDNMDILDEHNFPYDNDKNYNSSNSKNIEINQMPNDNKIFDSNTSNILNNNEYNNSILSENNSNKHDNYN